MADLPSTFSKVNDVEVTQDAPITEDLLAKIGSDCNYLKDNLDTEITNRAAGDATNATAISNTNADVAYQTTRINNAKNITRIYNNTDSSGPSIDVTRYILNASDGDNYKVLFVGPSPTFTLTDVLNSGVAVASNKIPVMTVGHNGSVVFIRLQIWQAVSV